MALLSETRTANNNLSSYDELTRKIATIESQTIAWMAEATALHGNVEVGDRSEIIALRTDLIARLTAATAV